MVFFILQNGLVDRSTHFFNESLAWRAACDELGLACRIYGGRALPSDIAAATGATAVFAFAPEVGVSFDLATRELHNLVVKSEVFAADCAVLDAEGVGPDDIVVVPYARGPEMLGLARWLLGRKRRMRPRVVAVMHRPDDDWTLDDTRRHVVSGDTGGLRYSALRLDLAAGAGRFLLAATNWRLAQILQEVTGLPAVTLPVMNRYPQDLPVPRSLRAKRYDVGVLGQLRAEKGGTFAGEILIPVCRRRSGLSVIVQAGSRDQARPLFDAFEAAGVADGLSLLIGEQSPEAYFAAIAASRLLLLPYNPERYRARVSGLLIEAAGWGRPVVVPAGTWLADMIEEGRVAGRLFAAFGAESIGTALERALDDLEALTAQAQALAPAWRAAENMERAVAAIVEQFAAAIG